MPEYIRFKIHDYQFYYPTIRWDQESKINISEIYLDIIYKTACGYYKLYVEFTKFESNQVWVNSYKLLSD